MVKQHNQTVRRYDVPMYVTLTDLRAYVKLLKRDYPKTEIMIDDIWHDALMKMEEGLHVDDMILDCLSDLHHILNIRKKR